MTTEAKELTYEEAVAMLPDPPEDSNSVPDVIHTFRGGGYLMIGADWPRDSILRVLREGRPELAGPLATAMRHGLAVQDAHGKVFIATR